MPGRSGVDEDVPPRLLVSPSGEVKATAGFAAELINRSACLRLEGERLLGASRFNQAKLDRLLAEALRKHSTIEELFAPGEEETPTLFVAARTTFGAEPAAIVLVVREMDRESVRMPDLVRLFALTRAESQVIAMLLNGMSVAQIAEKQKNSELTVRTHLKRAYSKIGIRTKEQLFAKVLRLLTD